MYELVAASGEIAEVCERMYGVCQVSEANSKMIV